MEDSGVPRAEIDMEIGRSSSVVDPDTVKAVFSAATASDDVETLDEAHQSSGLTGDMLITSTAAAMKSPKNGLQSHCWHQWVDQNRFSPLSNLGNEMDADFGEGEDQTEDFSEYHEVAIQPRSVDTTGFYQNDSGLLLLPWDNSGVDNRCCDSGEKDNCLLECDPLSRWDPNALSELLMVQEVLVV